MLTSASALLLTAISAPAATDVTPASLAVHPHVAQLNEAPYDWALQQGRGASGLKLADNTANCNTGPTPTNIAGQADHVPDCSFD
jgi:hypothetical protein